MKRLQPRQSYRKEWEIGKKQVTRNGRQKNGMKWEGLEVRRKQLRICREKEVDDAQNCNCMLGFGFVTEQFSQ